MAANLATLLHLLVFVYWLGGDLGAFYGSGFLVDPKRTMPERMLALKILNAVDMAPRTALILAFPTGLLLALIKGWVAISGLWVITALIAGGAWLALAWKVHLAHGPAGELFRKIDLAVRYCVLAGLTGTGIAALVNAVEMPIFIAVKLLVLAGCVALGLLVRIILTPMIGAIRIMLSSGPTVESDAVLAATIRNARPAVLCIWALLLLAAYMGVATPI